MIKILRQILAFPFMFIGTLFSIPGQFIAGTENWYELAMMWGKFLHIILGKHE